MSNMIFNLNGGMPSRFYDHARLGLTSEVKLANSDYQHESNIVEKAGNGLLHAVSSLPRSIRWIGHQFQDPRVVTVMLTALALLTTTMVFYPVATLSALAATFHAIKFTLALIPLWGIRLSAYILTCSTILGYGLRSGGRFGNAKLMSAFYGVPYQGNNPANLPIDEIRRLVRANQPVALRAAGE